MRTHNRRHRIGLVAAVLLLAGCDYDNHATWWLGDVATDWHDCRGVKGSHAVLDLKEFRAVYVVPFAYGGFRLFVITEPGQLSPGTTLSIPSPQARAILCNLSHGASDDAILDLTGTIEVLKRRGEDVLLRIDLKGDGGSWSHRSKQWFERQGTPTR